MIDEDSEFLLEEYDKFSESDNEDEVSDEKFEHEGVKVFMQETYTFLNLNFGKSKKNFNR